MRYLPILLIFLAACTTSPEDTPNVDFRVYASVGDCMPITDPVDSTATLYSGYLNLYDRSSVLGYYDPQITPLRVYRGQLRMTLDPGRYELRLQAAGSTTYAFTVADTLMVGDVYLRQCLSY